MAMDYSKQGETFDMSRSIRFTSASILAGVATALVWLKAPIIPAVLGALGAGLVLYWRAQRAAN